MEQSPIGSSLDDFLDDLWTEASQAGEEAIREVVFAQSRARLAREIHAARRACGLTQEQLAQQAGIDQPEISRIEAGQSNPTLKTLSVLAHALAHEIAVLPQQRVHSASTLNAARDPGHDPEKKSSRDEASVLSQTPKRQSEG
jgi:transcriptional regulator with XRE-family HTH domain